MLDDGGPLVKDGAVVGIASWEVPGKIDKPQILTDVNTYVPWILKNAKK